MKFGYLSNEQLDRADLSLPADEAGNSFVLKAAQTGTVAPQLHVGCAEYRVKEWKGLLYPTAAKEADMLALYARRFHCMEMNGTHYRIYEPAQIRKWVEKTGGNDFLFLPKFPQAISHEPHSFEELAGLTDAFLESADAFKPKLGPLFLQMSEHFTPASRASFFRYLATLPEGYTYFLELRHPQWFADPEIRFELFTALREMGIGAVITDTPGHREILHMALTVPKVMVRFVGRHSHPSTQLRIQDWIKRLKGWLDASLQEVYFIAHTGLSAPLTARHVIEVMNAQLNAGIPVPQLLSDQHR